MIHFFDIFKYTIIILVLYAVLKWIILPNLGLRFYAKQGIKVTYFGIFFGIKVLLDGLNKHKDILYFSKMLSKQRPDTKMTVVCLGTRTLISIVDPGLIKELAFKDQYYVKDMPTFVRHLLSGGGLPFLEGDTWKKNRKIISQSFHFEFLKQRIPIIVKTARGFINELKQKDLNGVDILREMQYITGDVVGKLFFGENLHSYTFEGKPLSVALTEINENNVKLMLSPAALLFGDSFIELGLFPSHREALRKMRVFRAFCMKILQEKKARGESNDLIGSLFKSQNSKDPEDTLTDDRILDEFLAFFSAGMDSTAHLVVIALYLCLQYPDCFEKIKQEINEKYSQEDPASLDSLNSMDYTTAFLKECLRLYSPAPGTINRKAIEDHQIGEFKIRKGDTVRVESIANHCDSKYFDEPDKFYPERWLVKREIDSFAYIPFWVGPRNCIGQHLAMLEARIIIAEFIKAFHFELIPNYVLKMTFKTTYEPLDPVKFNLKVK